jgi:cytochrome c oxidase assembly protein subunit 15
MHNKWLHRYSILLAAFTLFLLVAGGMVTSFEAGDSVPDWPLSHGQLMPEMKGNVFYEHGHRMVASTVGLLTVMLALWLWRADDRRWMRTLGWVALAAVIAQGVLGGMRVLLLELKPASSIVHACIAQLFFSLTVAIALFTSATWRRGPEVIGDTGTPPLRTLAILTALAVFTQLALGAAYRHKAIGLAPHVVGAVVVAGVVLFTAICALQQFSKHRQLRTIALFMLLVTQLQIFAGIGAYIIRIYNNSVSPTQPLPPMVALTVTHVALGAITLASSILFAIQVVRHVRRPLHAQVRTISVPS